MSKEIDLKEAQSYIKTMDLDIVLKQLTTQTENKWSRRDARIGIEQYKNYLYLIKKYTPEYPTIPPSKHIDDVWHQHILNTKKYYEDCSNIFGHFYHHTPGERTKRSIMYFHKLFDEVTQELYFKEFGEYL